MNNPLFLKKQSEMIEPYLIVNQANPVKVENLFDKVSNAIEQLPHYSVIKDYLLEHEAKMGEIEKINFRLDASISCFKLHISLHDIKIIPQRKIFEICKFLLSYNNNYLKARLLFEFKIGNHIDERSYRQNHEQFAIYLNRYSRIADIKYFMKNIETFLIHALDLGVNQRSNDQDSYKDKIIFNTYLSGRTDSNKLAQTYGTFPAFDLAIASLLKNNCLDQLPIGVIDYIHNEVLIRDITATPDIEEFIKQIANDPHEWFKKIIDLPQMVEEVYRMKLENTRAKTATASSSEQQAINENIQPPTSAVAAHYRYHTNNQTLFDKPPIPVKKIDVEQFIHHVILQIDPDKFAKNTSDVSKNLKTYLTKINEEQLHTLADLEKRVLSCLTVKREPSFCFQKPRIMLLLDEAKLATITPLASESIPPRNAHYTYT